MAHLFGYAREYADLDAQYHQQPRERVPPFTPAPYMHSVSSPATALDEAARARHRVADCAMEPEMRRVHMDSHRWWLNHAKTIRERMAASRDRFRAQARMNDLANRLPASTDRAVEGFREAMGAN
jgi:hypothetical protein